MEHIETFRLLSIGFAGEMLVGYLLPLFSSASYLDRLEKADLDSHRKGSAPRQLSGARSVI